MIDLEGPHLIDRVKTVSRETRDRLTDFHDLLVQWQARINLIAPSTIGQIWSRHIVDSLQIYYALDDADDVIDIGSGAGFPGLVIGILMAEAGEGRLRLVESNGKKCAFMSTVIRNTGLRDTGLDIQVVNKRIEQALPELDRPKAITARALAPLDVLFQLTQKPMQAGAVGIFPKGRDHQAELETARNSWDFQCDHLTSDLQDGSVILKISALKPL